MIFSDGNSAVSKAAIRKGISFDIRARNGNGALIFGSKGIGCALAAHIEENIVLGINYAFCSVDSVECHIGFNGGAVRSNAYYKYACAFGPNCGKFFA